MGQLVSIARLSTVAAPLGPAATATTPQMIPVFRAPRRHRGFPALSGEPAAETTRRIIRNFPPPCAPKRAHRYGGLALAAKHCARLASIATVMRQLRLILPGAAA